METFSFDYPAAKKILRKAHTGVVGSGDMEIILEPGNNNKSQFVVRTSADGFKAIWKDVFDRFVATNDIDATITINDFGATPGVVGLRLAQAYELSNQK